MVWGAAWRSCAIPIRLAGSQIGGWASLGLSYTGAAKGTARRGHRSTRLGTPLGKDRGPKGHPGGPRGRLAHEVCVEATAAVGSGGHTCHRAPSWSLTSPGTAGSGACAPRELPPWRPTLCRRGRGVRTPAWMGSPSRGPLHPALRRPESAEPRRPCACCVQPAAPKHLPHLHGP